MQNFGNIKNIFNHILVEGLGKEENVNKGLFKEYVKAINENEILKTQFMVYTNIENRIDVSEFMASQYIKENIALLDKFDKKDIRQANLNLATLIMFEQADDFVNDKEELHKNIAKLIFTEKNGKSIDTIVESIGEVVKYIQENKAKVINEELGLPNSLLASLSADKFNERYADLSESEGKILKTILDSKIEDQESLYTSYIHECVDSIDSKLDESDINKKDKLLKVKDKLLRMKYVSESFVEDISKLVDLKNDLK